MKTFLGIDHPALAAEDATKLAQWYCEVLGYEIIAQTDKPIYIIKAPDETKTTMNVRTARYVPPVGRTWHSG